MSAKLERLCEKLKEILGGAIGDPLSRLGEVTMEVPAAAYHEVAKTLRDHAELKFEELVSHLLSMTHNWRLRLRVFASDNDAPSLPTVTDLWPGANWYEREAFDLFGIVFEGHPDLRRILTDYGFVGHPFRKDFPVSGYVEMRYDPEQRRVVYQPVTIEPREVTPRIVREESYGKAGGRG